MKKLKQKIYKPNIKLPCINKYMLREENYILFFIYKTEKKNLFIIYAHMFFLLMLLL